MLPRAGERRAGVDALRPAVGLQSPGMQARGSVIAAALLALAPGCVFDLPPLTDSPAAGAGGGDAQGAGGTLSTGGASAEGGGNADPSAELATDADEIPQAIAVAANGDLLVAGTFSGRLEDPTRGAIESRGRDAFIARYAPDGTPVWRLAASSDADDDVFGAGVIQELSGGQIAVAVRLGNGARSLSTPQGDVDLPDSTNADAMVLVLDPNGGSVDVGFIDGQTAASSVRGLATDGNGYWFAGSWGTSSNGAFVGRVDAGGNAEWLVTLDGGGSESIGALVAQGDAVVAVGTDADGLFAIKLAPGGSNVWTNTFAAQPAPDVRRAVALADGRIAVVGTTRSTITLGAAPPIVPAGDGDGFVLVLTNDGAASAGTTLGDASPALPGSRLTGPGQAVFDAVASGDGLVVAGAFVGSLATLGPAADEDAFVVRLDGSLAPIAARTFAGPSAQWGAGIATAADLSFQVLLGTYDQVDGLSTPPGGGSDVLIVPASL